MDNPIVCPKSLERKFSQHAPSDKKTCGCVSGVPSVVVQIVTIKEDTGSATSQHKCGNGISAGATGWREGSFSPWRPICLWLEGKRVIVLWHPIVSAALTENTTIFQVVLAASEDADLRLRREGGQEGRVSLSICGLHTYIFFLHSFCTKSHCGKYPLDLYLPSQRVSAPLWSYKHDISQLLSWK